MPGAEDFDFNAIAADIAGGAPSTDESGGAPDSGGAPAAPTPPTAAVSTPSKGSTPSVRPLPKSWKKEMEAVWGKLPPEAHDYIYNREADVARGFQQYRDSHENWQKLLSPYQDVFQQYPDLQPQTLLNSLLQTHFTLAMGTPEQKQQLWQQLSQLYGFSEAQRQQPDPALQRVAQLEQHLYQQELQKNLSVVEAFFANPQYPYANDLVQDIMAQVQAGVRDLPTAYERAKWLNPTIREKLLAQMGKTPPSGPTNIQTDTAPAPPAPRKGNIDDTIDAIANAAFAPRS